MLTIDHLLKVTISPSTELLTWLKHDESLTVKLQTKTAKTTLKVLEQYWTLPNWWEKFTLGLSIDSVLHRNILMFAGQNPCWYARTIVPTHCYQTHTGFFDRLAHESLGAIVFNETTIKRTMLIHYAIDERCIEYHWLPESIRNKNEQLWVRLSVFTIAQNSSFYLLEILLPELMRIINEME